MNAVRAATPADLTSALVLHFCLQMDVKGIRREQWTGNIGSMQGQVAGYCERGETFRFLEMQDIFGLVEEPLAAEEQLCCVEVGV
jgi:hypothetical protein